MKKLNIKIQKQSYYYNDINHFIIQVNDKSYGYKCFSKNYEYFIEICQDHPLHFLDRQQFIYVKNKIKMMINFE